MMEDKSTSVAMDRSVDLIKLRLPYLENELSNINGVPASSLKRSNSMIARLTYHTPRALHVENVSDSYYKNGTQKPRGKFLVGTGSIEKINQQLNGDSLDNEAMGLKRISRSPKKSSRDDTSLPRISKSIMMARYADRALFLDGKKMQSGESKSRPSTQPGKSRYKFMEQLHTPNPKISNNQQSDVLPLNRSKTEVEIIDQANEMLKESGLSEQNVLKQDIKKLGKGLSTMYLTDFGVHNERVKETAGMSQHKKVVPTDKLDDEMENTAHKHIYMCQIPSLLTRGSQARRSVHSLRRTITPRGYSRALENNYSFDAGDSTISSRLSSPKKPLLLLSEKSTIHEQEGLKNKGYYRSFDSINLIPENKERVSVSSIDVQGTPVSVYITSKRILER